MPRWMKLHNEREKARLSKKLDRAELIIYCIIAVVSSVLPLGQLTLAVAFIAVGIIYLVFSRLRRKHGLED